MVQGLSAAPIAPAAEVANCELSRLGRQQGLASPDLGLVTFKDTWEMKSVPKPMWAFVNLLSSTVGSHSEAYLASLLLKRLKMKILDHKLRL